MSFDVYFFFKLRLYAECTMHIAYDFDGFQCGDECQFDNDDEHILFHSRIFGF